MPKQDRLLVTVVNKFSGYVKSKNMILMYKTLFCPHLEYAVPICMVALSYTKACSISMESMQLPYGGSIWHWHTLH